MSTSWHITAICAILLHPLSLYRLYHRDAQWPFDAIVSILSFWWLLGPSPSSSILPVALVAVLYAISTSLGHPRRQAKNRDRTQGLPEGVQRSNNPLPPLLLPSTTSHSRRFPKAHSFSYSYLYVGIPIGLRGRAGRLLSADVDLLPASTRRCGWFNVCAEDHLDGTDHSLGLEGKLRAYLHTQNVAPSQWAYAYLVTAPRFLGYSFNPVSFWYLYDSNEYLVMMVLEVNNTFDERRMYLLKRDSMSRPSTGIFTDTWAKDFHVSPFNSRKGTYSLKSNDPFRRSASASAGPQIDNTITLRSSKDHAKLVARVHSTEVASDPSAMHTISAVAFLIRWGWIGFLTSPRIVYQATRLFLSRRLHVWFRPEVLSTSIARAATVEEEHIEFWFRKYIQHLVERFPRSIKCMYNPPSRMSSPQVWTSRRQSHSSATDDVPIVDEYTDEQTITLSITTPAFYSRFVHYAHTLEALDREGQQTDPLNRTVEVVNMALLTETVTVTDKTGTAPDEASKTKKSTTHTDGYTENDKDSAALRRSNRIDSFHWRILRSLRRPIGQDTYPSHGILRPWNAARANDPGTGTTVSEADVNMDVDVHADSPAVDSVVMSKPVRNEKTVMAVMDIRSFGYSPLDVFVQTSSSSSSSSLPSSSSSSNSRMPVPQRSRPITTSMYRRAVTRLFVAHNLLGGSVQLVRMIDLLIRAALAAFAVIVVVLRCTRRGDAGSSMTVVGSSPVVKAGSMVGVLAPLTWFDVSVCVIAAGLPHLWRSCKSI